MSHVFITGILHSLSMCYFDLFFLRLQTRDIKSYVHASDMANVRAEGDRRVIGGRARNQALQRAGELALEDRFKQVIVLTGVDE